MSPGFFLALEGLDGAGKTTLALSLSNELKAKGFKPVIFKEPTSGPFGQKIRDLGQNGRPLGFSPQDELSLFIQDRAFDLTENILPALTAQKIVILDRYILSSMAYQGALGLDPADILAQNRHFPWPNATLILEISPQLGLERVVKGRGDTPNKAFEGLAYLTKVAAIFQTLKSFNLPNVYRLDALDSIDNLTRQSLEMVVKALDQQLGPRKDLDQEDHLAR